MTGALSTSSNYWGIRFTNRTGSYQLIYSDTNNSNGCTNGTVSTTFTSIAENVVVLFPSGTTTGCIFFAEGSGDANAINVPVAGSNPQIITVVTGYYPVSPICLGVETTSVGVIRNVASVCPE
jgi:hypothetical protein